MVLLKKTARDSNDDSLEILSYQPRHELNASSIDSIIPEKRVASIVLSTRFLNGHFGEIQSDLFFGVGKSNQSPRHHPRYVNTPSPEGISRVLKILFKEVLINSGASEEDTEDVYRRPETKVLVDITRYSSETDGKTEYGWTTPYV